MIRFWPTLGIFKQGNHQIYGHIRCMIRFWPALGMFGTGKSPNIRSHMVYVFIRYSWQGNYQIYGHIQCVIRFWPTLGIFGREITKYTVTYGLCIHTVFLAGKSPNIRSHTVRNTVLANPRYFWQGNHQIYGHIRSMYIYGILGREITKYTVTYGADIRFWPTLHVQLHFHIIFGFRLDLHGDLQPDCSADRPVTGPRQSAIYFQTQKKKDEKMCIS